MKGAAIGKRVIQAAGWTTLVVLIGLAIFLFREGLPALNRPPYEGLVFAVHPGNPVGRLEAEAVRSLLRGEKSWADFQGPVAPVVPVYLGNLERYVLTHREPVGLRRVLDSLAKQEGVLFALPEALLPTGTRRLLVSWNPFKELFGSARWSPTYEPLPSVGVWPLIVGSLWVSLIGLAVVIPVGLAMAIYAVEFLPKPFYHLVKILWELLAGLPSVVVGFWGLVVLVPWVKETFHLEAGETAFTAGLILGWMTLPLMASLTEEALSAIPTLLVEASYGLGATQWQTIRRLKLPYVLPSLAAAVLLSAGRILGETMVVLIVSGNAPVLALTPLQPVRTLPATLAAELGEAPVGSYHYHVLFLLGVILFLLTLALNLTAYFIQKQYVRKG